MRAFQSEKEEDVAKAKVEEEAPKAKVEDGTKTKAEDEARQSYVGGLRDVLGGFRLRLHLLRRLVANLQPSDTEFSDSPELLQVYLGQVNCSIEAHFKMGRPSGSLPFIFF